MARGAAHKNGTTGGAQPASSSDGIAAAPDNSAIKVAQVKAQTEGAENVTQEVVASTPASSAIVLNQNNIKEDLYDIGTCEHSLDEDLKYLLRPAPREVSEKYNYFAKGFSDTAIEAAKEYAAPIKSSVREDGYVIGSFKSTIYILKGLVIGAFEFLDTATDLVGIHNYMNGDSAAAWDRTGGALIDKIEVSSELYQNGDYYGAGAEWGPAGFDAYIGLIGGLSKPLSSASVKRSVNSGLELTLGTKKYDHSPSNYTGDLDSPDFVGPKMLALDTDYKPKVGEFDELIHLGLQGKNSKGAPLPYDEALDVKFEAQLAKKLRDSLVSYRKEIMHPVEQRIVGEIDIETPNFIIEATMGRSSKAKQVQNNLTNPIVNPQGKPVVIVAPKMKNQQKIQNTIDAGAASVVHSVEQLLEFLRKNGGP